VLRGIEKVAERSTLLGASVAYPLVLAPTGFTRIADPDGELAVARAAARAGLPYTLSTLSTRSIEEVRAVSDGRLWFQVYAWRDRGLVTEMIERAAAARYEALVLTVDTAVFGRRERDVRRGFSLPPRSGPPRSSTGRCTRRGPGRSCAASRSASPTSSAATSATARRRSPCPTTSTPVRPGAVVGRRGLAAIGVGRPDRRQGRPACGGRGRPPPSIGVEAVALSNHGGRQLDGAPAAFSLVAPVVDAVAGRTEVICDGGVRRGSDIVKAVAAGATAAMAGRAYLYGLGAAG
jgi:L-lactate dehydrogenase (cytochrome)